MHRCAEALTLAQAALVAPNLIIRAVSLFEADQNRQVAITEEVLLSQHVVIREKARVVLMTIAPQPVVIRLAIVVALVQAAVSRVAVAVHHALAVVAEAPAEAAVAAVVDRCKMNLKKQ